MGKKGSWFSAIKRVFSPSSKDKVVDGADTKSSKEKEKNGAGKLKHRGEGRHSFIPIFRKPSSIEKILEEAERENSNITNYKPLSPPKTSESHVTPPPPPFRTASLQTGDSSRASSSLRATSFPSRRDATIVNVSTPTRTPSSRFVQRHGLQERHVCATKIQATYRGYMARRSYRALKGLVRLQGMIKGQSVKRQTASALKSMQLMVRVQNQINSRRIQTLENQVRRQPPLQQNDMDTESGFGKWNLSEITDDWEDSTLTTQEIDARMQRKVDAIVKRDRAMSYAYSQQHTRASIGFPHWRNWLEQHRTPPKALTTNPSHSPAIQTPHFTPTPTRPTPGFNFNKQAWTPPGRHQQRSTFKDDDSLMSCPPFSVPHYMAPTASAKAKVRDEKVRVPGSPSSTVSKRRSLFMWKNKKSNNQSIQSLADHLSVVDSTVSMPVNVGRKPFNRYV